MTANGTYTVQAVEESKQVMRSRAFHVKTDGSIAHSLATDTVEFLFGALTSTPAIPQQTALQPSQEVISQSSLREAAADVTLPAPDTNVIHRNGKYYDSAALYEMQEERGLDIRIPLANLGYARGDMRVADDVIAAADANAYILATGPVEVSGAQHYSLLFGADILLKARAEGADSVNAYLVDQEALDKAEVQVDRYSPAQVKKFYYDLRRALGQDTTAAAEAYEEEGTFSSGITHYDLNKIFQAIEESGMKPVELELSEVDWVLEHDVPRQDRVKAVDLSVPIVAMPYYNKHLAIDGLHRIARAKEQGRTKISAYVITRELFMSTRIRRAPETA